MYKKVLIISVVSFLLDQIAKIIIDVNFQFDDIIEVIKGFFYITRTSNIGAAFSILEGKRILFLLISIATIIILIKYIKSFKNKMFNALAFGLMIGGILGNFYDRLFFGYVRDFIKLDIFGYNYPIFNIADACIVIGVILLCICIVRGDGSENNSNRKRLKVR